MSKEQFEVTLDVAKPFTSVERALVAERIRIAIRTADERNLLTPDSYLVLDATVRSLHGP